MREKDYPEPEVIGCCEFKIVEEPLENLDLKGPMLDCGAGAYAAFEGWVRDENEGKAVTSLEYEAYADLAVKEGARVVEEARERFNIIDARCYHRSGHLRLGQMAVWVGVAAAHRSDAFSACRFIIDEVKSRVPIWKKEHYETGDSGWLRSERETSSNL